MEWYNTINGIDLLLAAVAGFLLYRASLWKRRAETCKFIIMKIRERLVVNAFDRLIDDLLGPSSPEVEEAKRILREKGAK